LGDGGHTRKPPKRCDRVAKRAAPIRPAKAPKATAEVQGRNQAPKSGRKFARTHDWHYLNLQQVPGLIDRSEARRRHQAQEHQTNVCNESDDQRFQEKREEGPACWQTLD
jgi:hypothetical protein